MSTNDISTRASSVKHMLFIKIRAHMFFSCLEIFVDDVCWQSIYVLKNDHISYKRMTTHLMYLIK